MIAIIDYNTGNLRSIENLFQRLGAEYIITADPEIIRRASHVLLPGVGSAGPAMEKLIERGLPDVIRSLTVPTMGICLGMQLLCSHSEEDDTECLGIFDTKVRKMSPAPGVKIPHVGWNALEERSSTLYRGMEEGSPFVYFVHSYAADLCEQTIATTTHGTAFSASLRRDNFYGCQFHPEKSGQIGEQIIKSFLLL